MNINLLLTQNFIVKLTTDICFIKRLQDIVLACIILKQQVAFPIVPSQPIPPTKYIIMAMGKNL